LRLRIDLLLAVVLCKKLGMVGGLPEHSDDFFFSVMMFGLRICVWTGERT
jgi:hypothetical protein